MKKNQKRKFHNRKQKKIKHNKFFSYNNEKRIKRNFTYKNFMNSMSYNTQFTLSNFTNVNFNKATMKFCGFNGAIFEGTEFKNANLRGSRFKGATFKNVIFLNTKLDKVNFKDAVFENVLFVNSSVKKSRGLKKSTTGITILNNTPKINLDFKLLKIIKLVNQNKFIKESETLVVKKGQKLNIINLIRLLEIFTSDFLIENLIKVSKTIKNSFYTLSYLINYLKKCSLNDENNEIVNII